MMDKRRIFIVFLLLFQCHIYAQDIVVTDSVYEQTEDNYEEEVLPEYYSDTVLYYSNKYVSADSIDIFKKSKRFAYATNLDSILRSMQPKKQAKDLSYLNKEESWLSRFFQSTAAQYIFWTLAVLFVGFILYKLFFTKGFFHRQPTKANVAALPEEDELSMDADYDRLTREAVTAKNYRLAVRYLYLKSLQRLSEKNAIVFTTGKTNYQYVREVTGKPYHKAFAGITLSYEYVWYGEFEIDEEIFGKLESEFKQFYNQL